VVGTCYKELLSKLCVGCGACLALCPNKAIELKVTNSSIAINVDHKLCLDCGLCISYCPPVFSLNKKLRLKDTLGNMMGIFFGHSTDPYIRYSGASGGIITSLSAYMLEKNIVNKVLVTKTGKILAKPMLTDDFYDILDAQGSIYFKTFTLRILKDIIEEINNEGKKICIVGTPCQIKVVSNLFRAIRNRIILVSFVCSHINELWYLQFILRSFLPGDAKPVIIGSRKNGWPGTMRVVYNKSGNLNEAIIPHNDFWGAIPSLKFSSSLGCLLCDLHLSPDADIVVSDAWHPKYTATKNSIGVSMIIARTKKGFELIQKAYDDGVLYLEKGNFKDLLAIHGHQLIESACYSYYRRRILLNFHQFTCNITMIEKIFLILQVALVKIIAKTKLLQYTFSNRAIKKMISYLSSFYIRLKLKRAQMLTSYLISKSQPNISGSSYEASLYYT
jgi:coenzyme F420 hydrogenase subunit beta